MIRARAGGALSCALALAACAPSGNGTTTEIHVFAAASLTEAMAAIAQDFEAAHPGTSVVLSFAGSQVLRLQIEQGARADVFASADPTHVDALAQQGLLEDAVDFAGNDLAVIVPLDDPDAIPDFWALDRVDRLVIGSPNVPVGRYTRMLFDSAALRLGTDFVDRVRSRIASEENNVRFVRAKIELGEADAGIVYRSDALASDRVRAIDVPAEFRVRTRYRIGRLTGSAHPELAASFVTFVRTPATLTRLRELGFTAAAP